jgi:hypothetical protein
VANKKETDLILEIATFFFALGKDDDSELVGLLDGVELKEEFRRVVPRADVLGLSPGGEVVDGPLHAGLFLQGLGSAEGSLATGDNRGCHCFWLSKMNV